MTEEELERASPPTPTTSTNRSDWAPAVRGIPPRRRDIHVQIDEDVLGWSGKPAVAIRPASPTCCAPLWIAASARRA